MIDSYGRDIHYMRISITDRCNLNCAYCMPQGAENIEKSNFLEYEDIIKICQQAIALGINRFKITGGEPFVRKDCNLFIKELCSLDGVCDVTITTNGILLGKYLKELKEYGVSSINISLDSLDENIFKRISGGDKEDLAAIRSTIDKCIELGFKTKINTVLLEDTFNSIDKLIDIPKKTPVDLRFIELMPIGYGRDLKRVSPKRVIDYLNNNYKDFTPVHEGYGNGPANYYKSKSFVGRIGFIGAISQRFCDKCNRIRLTSAGFLKSCLCFDDGVNLKPYLDSSIDSNRLMTAINNAIINKPKEHCFDNVACARDTQIMSQIGG